MFSSLPRCATARALQGLPATSRGGGQRTAREPSPAIKNGRTSNAAERGRLRQVGGSAPRGCARGGVSALTALREGSRGTGAEAAPRDEPAPARARWASITKCHQQLVCRVNGVCFCDALIARARRRPAPCWRIAVGTVNSGRPYAGRAPRLKSVPSRCRNPFVRAGSPRRATGMWRNPRWNSTRTTHRGGRYLCRKGAGMRAWPVTYLSRCAPPWTGVGDAGRRRGPAASGGRRRKGRREESRREARKPRPSAGGVPDTLERYHRYTVPCYHHRFRDPPPPSPPPDTLRRPTLFSIFHAVSYPRHSPLRCGTAPPGPAASGAPTCRPRCRPRARCP